MRILVVNPNSTDAMTKDIRRTAIKAASADTEVIAVSAEGSTPSIESFAEELVASAETLSTVVAHRGEFDAVVSACAYDPAVYALREVLEVPVIGIMEAASLVSRLVAPSFSVVTVLPRGIVHIEEVLTRIGLSEQCKSVIGVELGVLDLEHDREKSLRVLKAACDRAVQEDDAEAIVLGCAGMSFFRERLANLVTVPLLDGVECAIGLAELCHRTGLRTSKQRTFAPPQSKHWEPGPSGIPKNPVLDLLDESQTRAI